MSVISVWKCDYTGKLFEKKDDYDFHIGLQIEKLEVIKNRKLKNEKFKVHVKALRQLSTFTDIVSYINSNLQSIISPENGEFVNLNRIVFEEIKLTRYRNSTSSPIGYVECGTSLLPAFVGKVRYTDTTSKGCTIYIDDMLESLLIHTGTGGGNVVFDHVVNTKTTVSSYECVLWKTDFPNLNLTMEETNE